MIRGKQGGREGGGSGNYFAALISSQYSYKVTPQTTFMNLIIIGSCYQEEAGAHNLIRKNILSQQKVLSYAKKGS